MLAETDELTIEELQELVDELGLEDEFDNIEAEICGQCCIILGGGGVGC
ncbi:MAG: hypothetical protein HUJ69_06410 [Lachnospiraceae bacterium]|nr:hypothetical protein [Lachnospiraceae bacterium]